MHTLEIPDKKQVVDFPSEIDEMNQDQYLCYIELVLHYISGNIDENQFKTRLLQKLLDIRMSYKYALMSNLDKGFCNAEIVRLSDLMDCFIEDYQKKGKPVKSFKLKSVRNFVPKILGYYGPKDCFENLTYCEYRTAREYFRVFAESSEDKDLNHLVAVLYRPSKPWWFVRKRLPSCDGEIRIPINSKSNPLLLERRVKRIAKVPFHIRYSVFLYFSGCEDFLKTGKPVIDGIELDFSDLYKEKDADQSNEGNVGLIGLLYSIAETGVFGTIEQTDNQNIWDIMVRVYQVVMQGRAMEEKMKKHGTGS